MKVELWAAGADAPAYTAQVTDGTYSFQDIPEGSYVLKISVAGGVPRSYPLEAGSETVAPDVQICPRGDIDGSSKVNVSDVARAYAHARGAYEITDEYAFACGDLNGDGKINVVDTSKLYSFIKGTGTI